MNVKFLYVYWMHLPAKANYLSVQTFIANKSLSDSDSASESFESSTAWKGLVINTLIVQCQHPEILYYSPALWWNGSVCVCVLKCMDGIIGVCECVNARVEVCVCVWVIVMTQQIQACYSNRACTTLRHYLGLISMGSLYNLEVMYETGIKEWMDGQMDG